MSTDTSVEVRLDRVDCCGSGMCASLAPSAFEVEASGIARVLRSAVECDRQQLIRAAKSCPTACISLFDNGAELDLY